MWELWQPLPTFRHHLLRIRNVFRSLHFFVTKFNCFLLFLTAHPMVTLFLLLLSLLATCQCTRIHTAARSCNAFAVAYSEALQLDTLAKGLYNIIKSLSENKKSFLKHNYAIVPYRNHKIYFIMASKSMLKYFFIRKSEGFVFHCILLDPFFM